MVTAVINIPAMLIVALVTTILVVGIQESASVNNVIVIIKVAIVLMFIVIGARYFSTTNWGGKFIPENNGNFGHYGWSGVFRGAGVVFFAYIGFDAVSTTAQEAKNPQRDMPIGIIGSLLICTLLYVLGALVMTGVVSYKMLNVPDPVAIAIDAMGLKWFSGLVKLGAIAGLTSVILVMILSQPRIFFAMAKDGLLPRAVSKIHPKFRTPWITTIITGLVVMTAAGTIPIHVAGELTSIGTLFAFAVVSAGVFYLRLTQPEVERPFRAPFVYFTAPDGRHLVGAPHGDPAGRDLDQARRLDGHRPGDLLRLRDASQRPRREVSGRNPSARGGRSAGMRFVIAVKLTRRPGPPQGPGRFSVRPRNPPHHRCSHNDRHAAEQHHRQPDVEPASRPPRPGTIFFQNLPVIS